MYSTYKKKNKFKDFIKSDVGQIASYNKRKQRRICIDIEGIEPQSKKMPKQERVRFQTEVAKHLSNTNRNAFLGHIALKIDLGTTSKNAPQLHTIAKNLLDLLSKQQSDVGSKRKYLLYKDDSQIQSLSISCRHGESAPRIYIEGRPFKAMLEDLELASKVKSQSSMNDTEYYYEDFEKEWINTFRKLIDDEIEQRKRLGDALYDAYRKMVRWSAQKALFNRSGVNLSVLSYMYGLPENDFGLGSVYWSNLVDSSMLRLQVGELPVVEGDSELFKQRVLNEIELFKKKWDWIINPLVVTVALEVLVRPNPKTPIGVLHDLDNIVRTYLIPGIVPSFGTKSDIRWIIDYDELEKSSNQTLNSHTNYSMPPSGTKNGITRYEVWRLPAIENEPGFVSVALVADMDAKGDLIDDIDKCILNWKRKA